MECFNSQRAICSSWYIDLCEIRHLKTKPHPSQGHYKPTYNDTHSVRFNNKIEVCLFPVWSGLYKMKPRLKITEPLRQWKKRQQILWKKSHEFHRLFFKHTHTHTHTHTTHTHGSFITVTHLPWLAAKTLLAHTGAHCKVLRKLLHNVTYEGNAKQFRVKYASLIFKTEGCGQISLWFVPAAICGHDGSLGFYVHFSREIASDPTEWFA